jgi:hypothetical protein
MFAVVGAGVGIAFILVAATAIRPAIIGAYRPVLDAAAAAQPTQAQTLALQTVYTRFQSILDQGVTVPFLAANLHVPAESIVIPGASVDLQTPISLWNGLAVLAIALAAFVSLVLAKPTTAREAVLQGAAASVPYAIGIVIIAFIASSSIKMSASSLGLGTYASGNVTLSLPMVALVAFCLVVGSVLGGMIGLLFLAYTSRRSFGDLVRELGFSFAGPIGGTVVALALALVLSLAVCAGTWAYVKSTIPAASQTPATEQGLKIVDNWVSVLSPSLAFYVYDFGHGAPYAMDLSSIPTLPSTTPTTLRVSIVGVSAQDSTGRAMPGGLGRYDWWVYLLILLPIVPLTVGGYLSAAWSRGATSLALQGALVAIPYAIAMVALAWLTDIAMGAGTIKFALGDDLLLTAVLALAWGATCGALGGWVRQRRSLA